MIRDDYASDPLLNDLAIDIDIDDESGVDNVARDSDRSNSSDSFTHAMVNVRSRMFPMSVLKANTIVVSCGPANFEQTSWSTSTVTNSRDLMKNLTQGQTATNLLAANKTTTLKYATVVQCG